MQIKSRIGLAVGPADDTHWGQVLVTPNAYGIIEIYDPDAHAQQIGVAILSDVGEAIAETITSLKALEDIANRFAHPLMKTLVLMVPVGNIVYLVARGHGSVYVKRKEELASLMHQDGALSGEVKEGDTFLLASNGFSSVLSHDELTGLFDHLSPVDIAEKLTIMLHEKIHGEGSVALVFEVSTIHEDAPSALEDAPKEALESEVEQEAPVQTQVSVKNLSERLKNVITPLWQAVSARSIHHLAERYKRNPKAVTGLFVFVFIFLFIVSVVLGVIKQNAVKKDQIVLGAISSSQHAMEEGIALLELNPVKGRERLSEAKNTLEPFIKSVSPRSVEGRKIETMYRQINDNLTQAMQIINAPVSLFYDASLLKKGAMASSISLFDTSLAISDAATNTVYVLSIDSKNGQIVGGGDSIKNISTVGMYADGVYVVAGDGIMKIRLGDKKASQVVKRTEEWGAAASLVAFGGNLYVMDTQKSRIWKYVATEKGFSELREYLNPDTLPDLSKATDMAIDGSVWLGTSDGKILRFTQGKENTFIPKGVDPAFGSNLLVYTDDAIKNVYVLDSINNRVVVLDKDGIYLSQYRYSGAEAPVDFVVSETQKKIILLSGGKLYSIDLK